MFLQGDVYTWGKGKNGQMGNGEEEEANPHSIKVPLPVQAVAVGAGLNHCAAAGEDGNVYVWGRRMSDEIVEGSKATYQGSLHLCIAFTYMSPIIIN
jgi:alpha-tubulin suppressor-like RCC1 family protein